MRDIQELKEERSHKIRTVEDLSNKAKAEDRLLTDDEKAFCNSLMKESDDLGHEIAAIEDHHKFLERVENKVADLKKAPARQSSPSSVSNETPAERTSLPATAHRYGSLKAFKGEGADLKAYTSGQWLRAVFFNSYTAKRWCSDHGVDIHNALSEGTNTAGGYLVPAEFSQAIIDLREQYGVFRRNANLVPMGRDVIHIPKRVSGVTATFVDENSALTESDPVWTNVQLVAKKLGVMTRMSTEVAEDAIINLADTLASEMAYAFALKEDQCGFIGDGTSTYGGIEGVCKIFENNTSLAGSVVAATGSHDTFGEIDATDLATVMAKLPQYAEPMAKFYCSRTAYSLIFERLAIGAGGNTMTDVAGKYRPSYLGYPIEIVQVMNSGASTDYSNLHLLLFGDLAKAAAMGERRGITVAESGHRYFDTDQIAIKATERVDINVHSYGDTSTAGPIVCLLGGAS